MGTFVKGEVAIGLDVRVYVDEAVMADRLSVTDIELQGTIDVLGIF